MSARCDQQDRGDRGSEEGEIEGGLLAEQGGGQRTRERAESQQEREQNLDTGEGGSEAFQDGSKSVIDLVAILFSRGLIHPNLSRIRV